MLRTGSTARAIDQAHGLAHAAQQNRPPHQLERNPTRCQSAARHPSADRSRPVSTLVPCLRGRIPAHSFFCKIDLHDLPV